MGITPADMAIPKDFIMGAPTPSIRPLRIDPEREIELRSRFRQKAKQMRKRQVYLADYEKAYIELDKEFPGVDE